MLKIHAIYILVIIILGYFAYLQFNKAQLERSSRIAESEQVRIWRDAAGRSVAEATVVKTDYAMFKATHKDIVDSLKKEIGTAKVNSVVTIEKIVTDTVSVTRDARGLISYKDKWTKFFQPDPNKLSYIISDSISVVSYQKHFGFLNLKSKVVTTVANSNPHVSMAGAKSYDFTPVQRKIGFGAFAGIALGYQGPYPTVGIGAIYKIF